MKTKKYKPPKAPYNPDWFQLIDGNWSHHPSGYCFRYDAYLTEGLINTHGCMRKGCVKFKDGIDDEK